MKVLSVVGARPQFVKLAPIAKAAAKAGIDHVIVHTGQHYDPLLSDVFFDELDIPAPEVHLGVGSGSHGVQTGAILAALDAVIDAQRPDWVLVYGDTNSTLAGALSAVKLGVRVAHLEAGLRSFNRRMPEEHNRVLTDHASDLLLAPTETAMAHLRTEGLEGRALMVGDVMTDVLLDTRAGALRRADEVAGHLGVSHGEYYLATLHRAENTDKHDRLRMIVDALALLDRPVVLLAHPRLVARAAAAGIRLDAGALHPRAPLAYADLVAAVLGSSGVVTDSGGLQKEAFLLRVPCTTVRTETEWTETVALGWNVLANDPIGIVAAVRRATPEHTAATPYGDGHAAGRVIEALRARADRETNAA